MDETRRGKARMRPVVAQGLQVIRGKIATGKSLFRRDARN